MGSATDESFQKSGVRAQTDVESVLVKGQGRVQGFGSHSGVPEALFRRKRHAVSMVFSALQDPLHHIKPGRVFWMSAVLSAVFQNLPP